jgi:glycosyltransferase involved in cell wall biosynthesis
MRVVHIGIMGDIRKEGMIAQYIYDNCEGNHFYHWIGDCMMPSADIYILHCMKNILYLDKFITFGESKSKVISLIHSSEPCMPSKHSNKVIVLTKYWQKRMKKLYDIESEVIPGGIDVDLYEPRKEKRKLAFGKITRPVPGKFHKEWNNIVLRTLRKNKKAECRIICDGYNKLNYLKHNRMKWIEGVRIGDHKKKIDELSKLSIYTECHSDTGTAFIDTFNMSMIEAMALGIPVLLYKGLQESMAEVLGPTGYVFDNIREYEEALNVLLLDESFRKYNGEALRERAKDFSHKKLIERWNEILC